jgi:phosphoglycerate dehydrogenase-like enzyme
MAKYAHTFGMKILAYDPFISIYTDYVIPVKSLKELLTGSDIVSLHIPYTKENTHFINEEKFRLMKDGAFFINTARGEVVDEMAMLKALENGKLKGAAVDVISEEQVSDKWDHPVIAYARNHSNLLFTPHIAGLTVESEEKATWDIIRQIDKFFNK